jgi:hypothetical protein
MSEDKAPEVETLTVHYPGHPERGDAARPFSYDGTAYELPKGLSQWPAPVAKFVQERMKQEGVRIIYEEAAVQPEEPPAPVVPDRDASHRAHMEATRAAALAGGAPVVAEVEPQMDAPEKQPEPPVAPVGGEPATSEPPTDGQEDGSGETEA